VGHEVVRVRRIEDHHLSGVVHFELSDQLHQFPDEVGVEEVQRWIVDGDMVVAGRGF
jgi:hypothetical protein